MKHILDMGQKDYKLKDWIADLQKKGRITFSRQEAVQQFSHFSASALTSALTRQVQKGHIVSVWKGFYVIIPLKYAARKIVPAELYIDALMRFLNRPYYVGLLNAAAFYGAAHQQPQSFFVLTPPPALRDTFKRGLKIVFINKREIPQTLLTPFKTETGYVQVSSPELTAVDLLTYQKEIGGINRVATILNDLAGSINFNRLKNDFFEQVPVSSIQRLGYLLDEELEQTKLADTLLAKATKAGLSFQRIPLKSGKTADGSAINSKWKIIINEHIEIDE